jgi:hypothetical protein
MNAKTVVIDATRSGVYRAPARLDTLQKTAGKAGFVWMDLPLQAVSNKKQFLAICAKQ